MQTQTASPAVVESNGTGTVLHHAAQLMQTGASRAVAGTARGVRRYPLAALGVALATGIAIGAAARHVLAPQRPKSLLGRLGFGSSF